jgi:hypothetical protein
MTRFELQHIALLTVILGLPQVVITENRLRVIAIDALCIFLRRFAYPNRLFDCTHIFGRTMDELSRISNHIMHYLYDRFHHLLDTFNHQRLNPEMLEKFAQAIQARGGALPNTWGFIDATIRPIARPTWHQRQAYNGHKCVHALKFQAVMTPDGIISHLTGPWVARRHDSWILGESGLYQELEQWAHSTNGQPMYLYGDQAYSMTTYIMCPVKGEWYNCSFPFDLALIFSFTCLIGINLSEEELLFNKRMSSVRECVEWGFGKVVANFSFVDFKKNQKVFLQPVGRMYMVAVLMVNCHTCLYSSQTGMFFNLEAPQLNDYLAI